VLAVPGREHYVDHEHHADPHRDRDERVAQGQAGHLGDSERQQDVADQDQPGAVEERRAQREEQPMGAERPAGRQCQGCWW
jgi:hypothetical protein